MSDEYIIPPTIFEILREAIFLEFPYWPQNSLVSKLLLTTFHQFTNQKYQSTINWIAKKVKALFSLKDKSPYPQPKFTK